MKRWRIGFYLILAAVIVGCSPSQPMVVVITSTPAQDEHSAPTLAAFPQPTPAAGSDAAPAVTLVTDTSAAQHIVQWGDTLSQIAAQYDVSLASILAVNDLENPDLLEVNQIINLPQVTVTYTLASQIMSDARLVRSASAQSFDTAAFIRSRPGIIGSLNIPVATRQANGSALTDILSASQIVERVSLEYSVDPRILLALLEYRAGWLSQADIVQERQLYPFISPEQSYGIDRAGLYNQLAWLADQLNFGYYDWKYRGKTILDFPDGGRLLYHPDLNAGSVALQYVFSRLSSFEAWKNDVSEAGFHATYTAYFGNPLHDNVPTIPASLSQPQLSLPFQPGEIWRFTGGFHGGWGQGSGWAALDFSPPDEGSDGLCYTARFPTTSVAKGEIVRMADGVIVVDLDQDGNEGSGWTILYLHIVSDESLQLGQIVEAGDILGYASCFGGYATAAHLHIARRYNGEWIPADCVQCPSTAVMPPFIMGGWQAVGLPNQAYQGFLINMVDNRRVAAEQGRNTKINEISW